ncbi:MAG: hypothetical protein KTR25_20895 [Myxococcales bacterium]|nr:hypothetical protein [Myxococcales bacterium]
MSLHRHDLRLSIIDANVERPKVASPIGELRGYRRPSSGIFGPLALLGRVFTPPWPRRALTNAGYGVISPAEVKRHALV